MLEKARAMIDDSNMLTLRQVDIGKQQDDLIEKLKRRQRQRINKNGVELPLDNALEADEIEGLLKEAKALVDDQKLLATR